MALAKLHFGQRKRRLTTFELILISPFVLALVYMSAGSVVVNEGSAPKAGEAIAKPLPLPAAARAPEVAAAAVNTVAPVAQAVSATETDTVTPSYFNKSTTSILERIAPIARLNIAPAETASVAASTEASPAPVIAAAPEAIIAPTPAPVVSEARPAPTLQFEISDATGVDGLAKDAAQAFERAGLSASKISSIPVGSQHRVVILFRDGHEEDARRLSKLFTSPPTLVNNTRTRDSSDNSDIRLVLGSKAARETKLLN